MLRPSEQEALWCPLSAPQDGDTVEPSGDAAPYPNDARTGYTGQLPNLISGAVSFSCG